MFYKQSHGKEIILCHGFSFSLKFPLLSTIPNPLTAFSVHLMNYYFPDFWYSHATEKRILRREKCNIRKNQDIIWEQSTLWESVEKWVTKYLKKNHSEYRELQVKAMRIVKENPALRILINSMEGIVLTPEDHKALHKYIETKEIKWKAQQEIKS